MMRPLGGWLAFFVLQILNVGTQIIHCEGESGQLGTQKNRTCHVTKVNVSSQKTESFNPFTLNILR